MFHNPIYHFSVLPFIIAAPYSGFMKSKDHIKEVAEILAAVILRLHLRDVRKRLISLPTQENSLEVSTDKSLHYLEPKQRGKRR